MFPSQGIVIQVCYKKQDVSIKIIRQSYKKE